MAEIKSGGQLESLKNEKKVTSLNIHNEGQTILFFINKSSLSYLTIEEAMISRNELNEALKDAIGVK